MKNKEESLSEEIFEVGEHHFKENVISAEKIKHHVKRLKEELDILFSKSITRSYQQELRTIKSKIPYLIDEIFGEKLK